MSLSISKCRKDETLCDKDIFHMLFLDKKSSNLKKFNYRIHEFKGDNRSQTADFITTDDRFSIATYHNGSFYFSDNNSINIYSTITRKLDILYKVPGTYSVDAICVFMGKVYVFKRNSFVVIDPSTKKGETTAKTTEDRPFAACAIFGGRIVVSGGENTSRLTSRGPGPIKKSVEVYDHCANSWHRMPDMIRERSHHASVSIKNKLYMIGGADMSCRCEVYDSLSKVFVYIKSTYQLHDIDFMNKNQYGIIGDKIMIYSTDDYRRATILDLEEEEWYQKYNNGAWNTYSRLCY